MTTKLQMPGSLHSYHWTMYVMTRKFTYEVMLSEKKQNICMSICCIIRTSVCVFQRNTLKYYLCLSVLQNNYEFFANFLPCDFLCFPNFLYTEPRAYITLSLKRTRLNRTCFFLFKAKGTSSIFSTCLHLLCYNVSWLTDDTNFGCVEIHSELYPEIPMHFFLGWTLQSLIWLPCWGSVLQQTSGKAPSSIFTMYFLTIRLNSQKG